MKKQMYLECERCLSLSSEKHRKCLLNSTTHFIAAAVLLLMMTNISITKLYELLSTIIGKEGAENLTNFIESKIKDELQNQSQILATKDDLKKVELKITESKLDIIKWMFAFWVTIVLMLVGLYIKI